MSIEEIFKSEILNSGGYKGGKASIRSNEHQKIYKLSSNESIYGSPPSVAQIVAHRADSLNIYPSPTPQPLYEALEAHYEAQLTQNQFVAANGGSELLQIISRAFLDASTNCIISNPCFAPYTMFSSWTGATIQDVPLKGSNYEFDVDGILKAIDSQTRIIFLTSPNNPTGTHIKKAALERLLDRIPSHIIIVYDEVYHHFVDTPEFTIALPYVQKGHPIIAINSFSKAYGLAGLRVGYGYTTPVIAHYLRKLIRPFLINDLSLRSAIAALKDQDFINDTALKIISERKKLESGLQKLGLQYWPSQANFVLVKSNLDEHILIKKMQDHGVMVRPAGNFGAPGCIRITVGDEGATEATLAALATILDK